MKRKHVFLILLVGFLMIYCIGHFLRINLMVAPFYGVHLMSI